MTTLGSRVARGFKMPFPALARKLIQRGRAMTQRLVVDPASAWQRNGVSAECLRSLRTTIAPRFFISTGDRIALVEALKAREPEAVVATVREANEVCAHRFDLLGSGPVALGEQIDWHRDFKSGLRWEVRHHSSIDYMDLGRPSDVKVVWELSRCHHWVTLGQAFWLTGDDRYAREFLAQWESWMVENPLGFGVNWTCAMEAAIRAVNWLWAFFLFAEAAGFDEERQRRFLGAIADHGRFILQNLEVGQLPGNHYLTNGVALLTLAIVLPEVRESRRWLSHGQRIAWGEIARQVTPDGVDYEHAVGYHGYVLQCALFVVSLCRRNGIEVPASVLTRIEHMLEFTLAYTRPDGSVPAIGDADGGSLVTLGRYPTREHRSLLAAGAALFARGDCKAASHGFGAETLWWLGLPGLQAYDAIPKEAETVSSRGFPLGGFFVMRGEKRHLTVSASATGPASHLHHDLLSFECWADGIAYVVDPGTYTYTSSPEWRNRFRSTAFHNTIVVDGQEQTRLLDDPNPFPVERDATALFTLHRWEAGRYQDCFDGQHTGYTRLPQPVVHRRQIWFDKRRGLWAIRDLLTGIGGHRIAGLLHLAPLKVAIESSDPWIVRVGKRDRNLIIGWVAAPGLAVSVVDGWISPRYGVIRSAPVITYEIRGALPIDVRLVLVPARRGASSAMSSILQWASGLR